MIFDLPEEVRRGLDEARKRDLKRKNRLRLVVGDEIFPILRFWSDGFALDAEESPHVRGFVDIFDGGPTVHCDLEEIRSVRQSMAGIVGAIEKEVQNGKQQLVSNARLDFRACLGDTSWNQDQVTIDQVTALRLGLKVGDPIRCVYLKPESK